VDIRHLRKQYGRTPALRGADLTVERGAIFGLLGPNGAGKSTLLRVLLGLARKTEGTALLFGQDAWRAPVAACRDTAALLEGAGLYPHLSVERNLTVFGRLGGRRGADLDGFVAQGLVMSGLQEARDRAFRKCSAGMKQRLLLALTFSHDRPLLVLDEPTTALDASGIAEFKDWVRERNRGQGTTFLISSHRLAEMEDLCTAVAILREGAVLASGPMGEILGSPRHVEVLCTDSGAARDALQKQGFTAEVSASGVRVESAEDRVSDMARALLDHGVEFHGIVPRKPTLEERYMELCGTTPPPG
jgi:ABC-2 type transport system ATP-binding protein